MAEKDEKRNFVMGNRAPVLTLWAAVVAEVLGFDRDEALTLGRVLAGLNAYLKGVSLGLFQPTPKEIKGITNKTYPRADDLDRRFLLAKEGGCFRQGGLR